MRKEVTIVARKLFAGEEIPFFNSNETITDPLSWVGNPIRLHDFANFVDHLIKGKIFEKAFTYKEKGADVDDDQDCLGVPEGLMHIISSLQASFKNSKALFDESAYEKAVTAIKSAKDAGVADKDIPKALLETVNTNNSYQIDVQIPNTKLSLVAQYFKKYSQACVAALEAIRKIEMKDFEKLVFIPTDCLVVGTHQETVYGEEEKDSSGFVSQSRWQRTVDDYENGKLTHEKARENLETTLKNMAEKFGQVAEQCKALSGEARAVTR